MNILLLGATGGVGKSFLEQSLSKGDIITAIVRSPEKITTRHPNLTILKGDILTPSPQLNEAMLGKQVIVSCLNTTKGVQESNELQTMMAVTVAAMISTGVSRIIYCASAGVEDEIPGERGKEVMHFLRHPLSDHKAAIKQIMDANLLYTIARPGGLTNGDLTGTYNEFEKEIPQKNSLMICRPDVADFMLKALHNDSYIGKSIALFN